MQSLALKDSEINREDLCERIRRCRSSHREEISRDVDHFNQLRIDPV
jgi:hypothetical protein